MNKSKKIKNNNLIQSLNLPISNKIIIKILDEIDSNLLRSLIFQLYIKTFLLKKSLNLKTIYEIQLFQMKKKFEIESHYIENFPEKDPFMIDKQTEIEIKTLTEKDLIINTLKNENDKDQIKFDKIDFLKKNCENYIEYKNEKVYFIGMEDEYNKIKSLIDFCLFEENEKNGNDLIDNEVDDRFFYKVKNIIQKFN
jgi:hypothetical protein